MYSACPRFLCSEMYQWSQGIGAGWKNDIGELGPRDYWRKKLPLAVIFSLHRWAQTSQKLIFTLSRCTSMEGGGQRWLRKRNRIPKIGGRKDMWEKPGRKWRYQLLPSLREKSEKCFQEKGQERRRESRGEIPCFRNRPFLPWFLPNLPRSHGSFLGIFFCHLAGHFVETRPSSFF